MKNSNKVIMKNDSSFSSLIHEHSFKHTHYLLTIYLPSNPTQFLYIPMD